MRRRLSGSSKGSRRWRVRVSKRWNLIKKHFHYLRCLAVTTLLTHLSILSSLYTQIAPNDPFLAFLDRPSFMEKTILAMFVQERHADFQFDNDRLRPLTIFPRKLLRGAKLRVKDRLPSNATRRRPSEIDKQCPARSCWRRRSGWKSDMVRLIICDWLGDSTAYGKKKKKDMMFCRAQQR